MTKNIILASSALLLSSIFFVLNDAIINYLSSLNIKFYHFIFYGTPAYLSVPIYLSLKGEIKRHIKSTNYKILILRSLIFSPMPLITFLALKNISLPEFTTLNMASPLVGAILAYVFLKEKLNFFIYTSLIIGFFGVLFVVQPGFETFNIYFLVTLIGVLLITLSTTIVNKYNTITTALGFFIWGGLIIHISSFILFIIPVLSWDIFISSMGYDPYNSALEYWHQFIWVKEYLLGGYENINFSLENSEYYCMSIPLFLKCYLNDFLKTILYLSTVLILCLINFKNIKCV